MASLLYLRDQELAPELAAKLAPFIAAWRPLSVRPSTQELRAEGYEKVDEMTFFEELEEVYFENHGYYPEDNPILHTEDDK